MTHQPSDVVLLTAVAALCAALGLAVVALAGFVLGLPFAERVGDMLGGMLG